MLKSLVPAGLAAALIFFHLPDLWANDPTPERITHWEEYNDATRDRGPEPTLSRALKSFPKMPGQTRFAIDLGAGGGRDTLKLLRERWKVSAYDVTPRSLRSIRRRGGRLSRRGELVLHRVSFQKMKLPKCSAHLINASFSLPFVSRHEFPEIWDKVVGALKTGGIFSGHLFGAEDEWNDDESMTFFTEPEVRQLIRDSDLEVIYFNEVRETAPGGGNPEKRWHYFELVLRKPKTK